jgi:uncharacterized protein (DUF302 family)
MATKEIRVQRFSVISTKSFHEVLARVTAAIGHPDMDAFRKAMGDGSTLSDLEKTVQRAVGESGLMEFTRFDFGVVLRKELGAIAPQSMRLVAGNPLIMKEMVKRVPDAGSYAPVTILIDERADGVHLSYDTMTSFLESYGNAEALKVARDLDAKVEHLLMAAAA